MQFRDEDFGVVDEIMEGRGDFDCGNTIESSQNAADSSSELLLHDVQARKRCVG